jgi:hypothetical protein
MAGKSPIEFLICTFENDQCLGLVQKVDLWMSDGPKSGFFVSGEMMMRNRKHHEVSLSLESCYMLSDCETTHPLVNWDGAVIYQ